MPLLRDLLRANANALHGKARLTIKDGEASGPVTAHADAVALTLGDRTIPGVLDIDGEVQSFALGSSEVHVRGRATHTANAAGEGLTASMRLDDAIVRLGEGRSLDGDAAIEMSSALPALDAVTGRAALPTMIAALANTQALTASAKLHADDGGVWLRDIHASAGLLSARGVYAKARARTSATLLVEAGPLAVGVSVDGPQTSLVFADPTRWFDETLAARR